MNAYIATEKADRFLFDLWIEIDALLRAYPAHVAPLIVAQTDPRERKAILDREGVALANAIAAARDWFRERLYATEH